MSDQDFDRIEATKKLSKLAKKLDDTLIEELDNMSEADLKARIVSCEMNIEASEATKARDEALEHAVEELKQLRAPYTDTKKHQAAVRQYAALRLRLLEL